MKLIKEMVDNTHKQQCQDGSKTEINKQGCGVATAAEKGDAQNTTVDLVSFAVAVFKTTVSLSVTDTTIQWIGS